MTYREFIQNIYKGQSLDECEEHLKSFLKVKTSELIPEHLKKVNGYDEISRKASRLYEDCKNCKDCDEDEDADEDEDEDEDADEDKETNEDASSELEKKITQALKSKLKFPGVKFKKMIRFGYYEDDECDFVADFPGICPTDEEPDSPHYIDDFEKAVKVALKGIVKSLKWDPNATSRGDPKTAAGFLFTV